MSRPALQLWWPREGGGAALLARRLAGARGVRLAVVSETRSTISALLVFDSMAMREAYAVWAPGHLLTARGERPGGCERVDAHTPDSSPTMMRSR